MKFSKTLGGLAARRLAIEKPKINFTFISPFCQRKLISGLLLVMMLATSCDKKTEAQNATGRTQRASSTSEDSLDKPKANIKVNKHYDDDGNLVGFDSTYSSFYSDVKGDTSMMDSLMNRFDDYFYRNHSIFFNQRFNRLFFNDTSRYRDFIHDDFFLKRYQLNDSYMREMLGRMDSIKNHYFREESKQRKNTKEL